MDLSQFSAFMLAFTKRYPRTHATALQVLLGIADGSLRHLSYAAARPRS